MFQAKYPHDPIELKDHRWLGRKNGSPGGKEILVVNEGLMKLMKLMEHLWNIYGAWPCFLGGIEDHLGNFLRILM